LNTQPWPGETWQEAENLTHLDPDFKKNMSSATWNPVTRTFWVCCNGGPSAFWALVETGEGVSKTFKIATNGAGVRAKFVLPSGDFEGICQADYNEQVVYVMAEGADLIQEYDVSVYGRPVLNRQWNISANVPAYDGSSGSEGITFVPDEWLAFYNFVDRNGNPYTSRGGMGGLMFVAHQNGGRIYVFDLNRRNGSFTYVGSFRTRRSESSDLEFDRSLGLLYVWHNTGPNYLEVTYLSTYMNGGERYLLPIAEFLGPKGGNLEGIGILPDSDANNWCLVTDDDNQDGAALMWFKRFQPRYFSNNIL